MQGRVRQREGVKIGGESLLFKEAGGIAGEPVTGRLGDEGEFRFTKGGKIGASPIAEGEDTGIRGKTGAVLCCDAEIGG